MTACVNNEKEIKGGVSGKVLRTVAAGVLAMSMMPAAALAVETSSDADTLAVQASDPFKGGDFVWSAEATESGLLEVTVGDELALESATDAFGSPISMSDVTVVYAANGKMYHSMMDESVFAINTAYKAYVVQGAFEFTDAANTSLVDETYVEYDFKIVAKSLADSFAYEGDDTADTSFKYNGGALEVNFADADGNKLEILKSDNANSATADFKITGSVPNTNAGTYTVILEGLNDYAGSKEMVTYTISAIDLAKDEIVVMPLEKGDGKDAPYPFKADTSDRVLVSNSNILVNGKPLADGAEIKATIAKCIAVDGTSISESAFMGGRAAFVTLNLTSTSNDPKNVVNSKSGVSAVVVDELADFYYGNEAIDADGTKEFSFVSSKGQAFDKSALTAWISDGKGGKKQVAVSSVEVTKDGVAVTDYSEPGEYEVVCSIATAKDLSYAGMASFSFTVTGNQFSSQPKAFIAVDGKALAPVEYDGEAVVPTIVVKDGSKVLTAGTDYKVVYKDAEGNEVESMVEPGDYTVVVDFMDATISSPVASGTVENIEQGFTIDKAQVRSAKADKDIYEYTGEAVTPTFTAYSKYDCKGLSIEIDPAKTAVAYYAAELEDLTPYDGVDNKVPHKVKVNKYGEDITGTTVTKNDRTAVAEAWAVTGSPIAASDLDEEGFYVAVVDAPANDAHFTGTAVQGALFEIREYSKFEDVDAGAWYANSVYAARDNGYMKGVAGTKLFMPNASITRAEIAGVMFNMAGQAPETDKTFPTGFSDALADAWYSQSISWASQAGIMSGYAGTDLFGVNDKTTREQVAAIFYNYAKAQGKDVSVDVDAALAKVSDANTVSDWAKPAVAWAIENGVMGNGGSIWAQDTITRAEVAAMAVNFQPEALK